MKVECITTVLSHPSKLLVDAGWSNAEGYLTKGKEYDVLAVRRDWLKGEICYLLCDDNYDGVKYVWPMHIPAGYFVVKDNSIPISWISKDGSMGPEFLLDAGFYESLTDSEPKAISQFQNYLKRNTMQDVGLFQKLYRVYSQNGIDLSVYFCADNPNLSHVGLKKNMALKLIDSCKSHWLTIYGIDVICGYFEGNPSFCTPCWSLTDIESEKMSDRFMRSISESIDYINSFPDDSILFCFTIVQE